ncbi:MAG: TetR/AcrR family transcriptional regulator [Burkholderiales bacterium]|nr:TetR/AcrR family transcriptional regulator [Burkholderiales bacterium]
MRSSVSEDSNRRLDLLHAAARLFKEKGYEGASIRAISSAVGMRCGSPFYHFENKQAILYAVMEEGLRQGLARTEAALDSNLGAREQFERLVRVHLGILLEEGNDFIPVMLYNWGALDEIHRKKLIETKDRYDEIWQDIVHRLQAEGDLGEDPKIARLLLLGAMNFITTWYKANSGLSIDDLARKVVGFYLR